MAQHQQGTMDSRRAARHSTSYPVLLEHLRMGDLKATITNISANGFMIEGQPQLQRGDRANVRLPIIGQIEAYVIWTLDQRAGFQLERIIPLPDFMELLEVIDSRTITAKAHLRHAKARS